MTKTATSPVLQLIRRMAEDQRVKHLADDELLARFSIKRDEAAFHALVHRHGRMVLEVCRNVLGNEADADDAFQATFLILARKAGAIRRPSSVASWLYGVAYRTALKAKVDLSRRQRREIRVPTSEPSAPSADLGWPELRQVLHEELNKVSECYRAPLVLCYLEGKTQGEAAKILGVSRLTVSKRLDRGRALLRARLARRGFGAAAVLLAASWPVAAASAHVSSVLVSCTVEAAKSFAAGQAAAAGVISAKVAALTQGVLKTMLLPKLKTATAALLLAGLLVSGLVIAGLGALPNSSSTQRPTAQAKTPNQELAKKPASAPSTVTQEPVAPQWKERITIKGHGHERPIYGVAFSPDGKVLATAALRYAKDNPDDKISGEIKLWDATTGRELSSWKGHTTGIMNVAFAPDGQTLATADSQGPVKLWDCGAAKDLGTLQTGVRDYVPRIAFSLDGQVLVTTDRDQIVRVWDLSTKKERVKFDVHEKAISIALAPDSKTLAVSQGKTIGLWEVATGKEKTRLQGHAEVVWTLRFTPDGKNLITGSESDVKPTVKRWDVATGKELDTQQIAPGYVVIGIAPSGRKALVLDIVKNGEQTLVVWNLATRKAEATMRAGDMRLFSGAWFSPDGKSLAASTATNKVPYNKGAVKLWELK
jgi:RNA polymerase sigma factor (sigma-70 family)